MGIGFTHDLDSGLAVPSKTVLEAKPDFGLTAKQMQILGLSNDGMTKLPQVDAVSDRDASPHRLSSTPSPSDLGPQLGLSHSILVACSLR